MLNPIEKFKDTIIHKIGIGITDMDNTHYCSSDDWQRICEQPDILCLPIRILSQITEDRRSVHFTCK